MAVTPDHGLRYPGPDDAPDGPGQVKNLADDVEAALSALLADSGVRADMALSPAAGWSVTVKTYRTVGKKCYVRFTFNRDGADINANTAAEGLPGNIVDTLVATITDATLRPSIETFGLFRSSLTSGSSEIHTDGTVRIADAHTGSVIATNHNVNIAMAYPIP